MADLRTRVAVKIVDPTTNANEAGVTAAGNLKVDLSANTFGTLTVDSELPAAAALADNAANPTVPGVGAFAMVFDGTTWDRQPGNSASGAFIQGDVAHDAAVAANPLLTGGRASAAAPTDVSADGDAVRAWFLRNGAAASVLTAAGALIGGDATNGLDVDVTRVTGTVTVDSELPAAAALADAAANPTVPGVGGFAMGFNGATWDRIRTANTGRLQVDIITGGGTDTPTTPVLDTATSAALAAGSAANLDSADLGGLTRKLWQCAVTASVAFKAVVGQFENGASVKTLQTLFGKAGETVYYKPSHREFASRAFAANAGFDGYRAVVTNMDNSQAADVYAQFEYAAN